jgi:hypothetical protein
VSRARVRVEVQASGIVRSRGLGQRCVRGRRRHGIGAYVDGPRVAGASYCESVDEQLGAGLVLDEDLCVVSLGTFRAGEWSHAGRGNWPRCIASTRITLVLMTKIYISSRW